jgi:hypothetical protein
MPRNGSGTYTRPQSDYTSGTTIVSAAVNSDLNDMASALTASLARDGQTTPTGNLPMGGFRHTNIANGASRNEYAALGQVQDGAFLWGGTAGGTANAITVTLTPPITSYAAGQAFRFISSAANTSSVTLNVNGVGAVALNKGDGTVALSAGDLPATAMVTVVHDGTRFRLIDPATLDGLSPAWVDLASAATTDLSAVTANVRITGTTTITAFGTAASGVTRQLRLAAALTLTHNATSLILPGAANILTAAGDTATAISLGSGNWVVVNFTRAAAGYAGNIALANSAAANIGINLGTQQASTSGTSIDFTGIPAGVRRIAIMFSGVSTSGTSNKQIQLGDAGGVETTGYLGASVQLTDAQSVNAATTTTGFGIRSALAADVINGAVILENMSGNNWVAHGVLTDSSRGAGYIVGGAKSLSATLDRVRITTVNGTDTFDAGSINIMWEF